MNEKITDDCAVVTQVANAETFTYTIIDYCDTYDRIRQQTVVSSLDHKFMQCFSSVLLLMFIIIYIISYEKILY